MLDRLHGEINVEIGPTQMVWTRKLDVGDFHRGTESDRRTHRSSLIQYGPRQCRESETGGNERCHKLRKALLKQDCGSENLS